jgi:asparagine synthase (glutamine-hydrolysing)
VTASRDAPGQRGIETNGLRPLEIASSILFGRDNSAAAVALDGEGLREGPRAALEHVLLRALERPPCLLSFSGGRDSSTLLAVALRLARREGLPEPVPVTALYAGAPSAREDEWQQLVIDELRPEEWVRRTFDHEVDLVGPVARDLMRRCGLSYPYNLHLQAPLVEEARGGSFVTGLGGDDALATGSAALLVLAGHRRPVLRDGLRVAGAVAPRSVRRAVYRRRPGLSFPWLRPAANEVLNRAWLEDDLRLPLRWNRRLHVWRSLRYIQLALRSISRLAASADVEAVHPFADRRFVSALAHAAGARGYASRTAAFEALFGDVLPSGVLRRPTKASFDEVLWQRHSAAFVRELTDGRVDDALRVLRVDELVDQSALVEHWTGGAPLANSFLLLQACWLALQTESPA